MENVQSRKVCGVSWGNEGGGAEGEALEGSCYACVAASQDAVLARCDGTRSEGSFNRTRRYRAVLRDVLVQDVCFTEGESSVVASQRRKAVSFSRLTQLLQWND